LDFVELNIAAIKQSDSQNNAYVLLLNETNGERQLPIVIGWCEARSIAIALDGSEKPDRPLTHDLFRTMGDKFNIKVNKIVIHTLIEGIFHAAFHCINQNTNEETEIDARTSDAIAIAIRYGCPIFTYEDILSRAGIIVNNISNKSKIDDLNLKEDKIATPQEINTFSTTKLKKMLQKAIEEENYEKASELRDEINKRKRE
tara:strand:+ start:2776 stop:3378 length:603 start_codon:yes stop_codon:yes gene_type:complete